MNLNPEKYLNNLKEKGKKNPHIKEEFQEIGLQMQKFFPKKQWNWIWSLFYKYPLKKIEYAFKVCKDRGVKDTKYLIAIIKNM